MCLASTVQTSKINFLQIEQFIESIFPTQNPQAIALQQAGETSAAQKKSAAEEAEAKKDVFYLMLAVFGTLIFVSGLMVCLFPQIDESFTNTIQIGAAWLAGARFDVALNEIRKGNYAPKDQGIPEVQNTAPAFDHAEL